MIAESHRKNAVCIFAYGVFWRIHRDSNAGPFA